MKWFETSDGSTWEQKRAFGPLTAIYGPDGELISRPYTRTWEHIEGPKTEIPVAPACLQLSGASR